MAPAPGTLYLIPTPLGLSPLSGIMPQHVQTLIQSLHIFIVEHPKTARAFLKQTGHALPLNQLTLLTLNEHTDAANLAALLAPLLAGHNAGLLSEAGAPAVADPGAALIKLAHDNGIVVRPQVGPSAILLALMASGLNGQHFCFHGYLPSEKNARIKKLEELERASGQQTQIFIEAPYRNQHLLKDIVDVCKKTTHLCLATEITLVSESVRTQTIDAWRAGLPNIEDRPTVFLLQKS